MALGSTQPLAEMRTRNLPGGKGRPVCKTITLSPSVSQLSTENVGASTSHNPMGLHGLLQGQLYLFVHRYKEQESYPKFVKGFYTI
jgi:hypothetical protein